MIHATPHGSLPILLAHCISAYHPFSLYPEQIFLNLTGGGLGKRSKNHCFRHLEAGQTFTTILDHFCTRQRLTGFDSDKGARMLTPFFIAFSDNCGLNYLGMPEQDVFDLNTGYILATTDNDVL